MATVVLAEDTLLGRQVALKRVDASGDDRILSRLRREALVGASLSHPNLVSIYDVIVETSDHVIVMEYVEGETLRDALRREQRLPPAAALKVLEGVGAALDAIHRRGIVHRDVKPANILLGADGAIKLADLGIATVADRTRITTAGTVLGTFSYMAPEQLEGASSTPAVDVYALSAVAFEALSGSRARTEENPVALAHAISTRPPPDLRTVWPGAPVQAAELLIRGMSRNPKDRPRSAGELTGRLRAALEPSSTAAIPIIPSGVVAGDGVGGATPRERAVASDRQRVPSARPRAASAPGPAGSAAAAVATPPRASPPPSATPAPRSAAPRGSRLELTGSRMPRAAAADGRSRHRILAAGLIGLAAIAVVLAVVLGSGASSSQTRAGGASAHPSSARSSAKARGRSSSTTAAAPGGSAGSSTGAPTSSTPSAASAPPGSPVSAVESFYRLAAAHQYQAAWRLADSTFRAQLRGYDSFRAGQAGDKSIIFDSARVLSQSASAATVAVKTTSVRTDGTHRCAGTVELGRVASTGWLMHLINIRCT